MFNQPCVGEIGLGNQLLKRPGVVGEVAGIKHLDTGVLFTVEGSYNR